MSKNLEKAKWENVRTFKLNGLGGPSKEFEIYLKEVGSSNEDICPYLVLLPEDVRIVYPTPPSRKYEKSSLFCSKRAERMINCHCFIGNSPVREHEGELASICSEGRLFLFQSGKTIEISKKKKNYFLSDRR